MGQMASYLRRAAISAALGVVSSYLSNYYSNWLDKTLVALPPKSSKKRKAAVKALSDSEREQGGRPPRLGFSNVNPPLYGGNMIKEGKHLDGLCAAPGPLRYCGNGLYSKPTNPRRTSGMRLLFAQLIMILCN